jgi:hypothetical protein
MAHMTSWVLPVAGPTLFQYTNELEEHRLSVYIRYKAIREIVQALRVYTRPVFVKEVNALGIVEMCSLH